jgi:hypothetical protein
MTQSMNLQNKYEIKICGQLEDSWLPWFGEANALIQIVADGEVTTFSNIVMDQAGLVGLIRRLHGHGIILMSIHLV